jgi:gliding motility-associated-like protein
MGKIIRQSLFFFIVLFLGCTVQKVYADAIHNQGFILNKGQWPDSILSRATFAFGDVIVQKDGIVFFLRDGEHHHTHGSKQQQPLELNAVIHTHAYKMKFRNGKLAAPQGFNASSFHVNFIKGSEPSQAVGNLLCYKKLIVENIYPSIDLVLYVTDNGVKYDLLLKGNADPKQIIIDYEGTDGLTLDAEGNLSVNTSLGTITEKMPIAFVEKNNQSKEPVICRYQVSGNTVRFNIRNLTKAREEKLVIDPQLIFATYSGSYSDNWGNTATYDESGSLYAAGIVFGGEFPNTTGASYNLGGAGDPDVAIMKFSSSGALIYATYLGGGLTEVPTSTIVNKNNELYILGTTGSDGSIGTGFPVSRTAYQKTLKGGSDIYPLGLTETVRFRNGSDLFVTRLSADGSSIIASTLIGGSRNDGLFQVNDLLARNYGDQLRGEILLDSLDYVYIASHTESNDIINTSKPGYKTTANGGKDGIVIKLLPDLSDIVWNTYWGGNAIDACYSLQFGSSNDVYVTGGTKSPNLPTSSGVVKPAFSGLPFDIDGFVVRFSKDSCKLLTATYLGTTEVDQSYIVQTDKQGFVYVLGQSQGSYPVVNAPYTNANSHQFIHKLNANLSQTIFSTVIGSGRPKIDFVPTAFLVNDCSNLFFAGWGGWVNYGRSYVIRDNNNVIIGSGTDGLYYQGGNTDFLPLTPNAYQTGTDGDDFYLMVLEKDVQKILYATMFGGQNEIEHVDGGTSRFDKRGIVYQSVCAGCGGTSAFPVSPNAYSPTNNSSNCNNAVFKFDLSSLKADFEADTSMICGISPVTFTNKSIGGVSFVWNLGDGSTSTSATTFSHTYTQAGTYTVQLIAVDEATCIGRDTAEKIITIYDLPKPQFALDTVLVCKGDTAQLSAVYNPDYTYTWSPNQYLTSTTIYNPQAFPPSSQYYKLHIKDNVTQCENTDSVWVRVVQALADTRYENTTGCSGQPSILVKNFSDKDTFTYVWDFGDGTSLTSSNQQVAHSYNEFGDYIVTVIVSYLGCSITDTVQVHLPPIKIPNLFTPNGDGHNDKYVIEGMTKNWKLEVYNRWGNSIYTREPYDQSWDGGDLNGGIYYFLITDPAGNKCKGWVHVLK